MQAEKNISKLFTKEGIIAYLQNKLSKDERAMFEKHLQQDEFLKDAVEGYKLLPAKDLHKHLNTLFADVDMLAGASKKSKLISMQTRPLAIAAMLLVFIGVAWFAVWFMNDSTNKQQIAQAEKIYDEGGVDASINENSTSTKTDILPESEQETKTISQGDSIPFDKSGQVTTSENAIAYDDFKSKNQVLVKDGENEERTEINATLAEAPTVVFNEEIRASESNSESFGYNSQSQTGSLDEVIVTDETKRDKKSKKANAAKDVSAESVDDIASGVPAELDELANDSIHIVVDQMPEFVGGENALREFIEKNFLIPADKDEYTGKVYVKFVIGETGEVTNAEVIKGLENEIDKEAVRVVSIMPDWIPGKLNGKNVKVSYTLPIAIK
ncbi:MAG: energy transducer TonB [Chitinophagales bacterium]